jgi:hypothetical protein
LGNVRRGEVGLDQSRRACVHRGVSGYPSPSNGLSKRSANYGVDLAHRRGRETNFIDEAEIETIEVHSSNTVDGLISDCRKNSLREKILIAAKCRRAEIVFCQC